MSAPRGDATIERTSTRPGMPALMTVLLALNLAAYVDRMIFAVLAPAIQPALHLTNPQLGIVQGPAFALPYAAALPFAGWLGDRWGARRVLAGSIGLWSAGLAVSAAAGGLTLLVAGRALCGIGQSALTPVALGVIGGTVAPGRAGRAIALFTGTGTLGRSAAFGIGGLLLAWFSGRGVVDGWAAVLAVLVVLNAVLIAVVLGARALPDRAAGTATTRRATGGIAELWAAMRGSPALVGATVAAALGPVVIVQAVTAWVATAMIQAQRVPASRAAGLIALATLAAPLGHLLGGWAIDRAGDRRAAGLVQAGLAALCVPATMALAWGRSPALAVAGIAAIMLLAGAGSVAGLERVQRLVPAPLRGTANGVFLLLVYGIGVGGGPLAVGLVAGNGAVGGALTLVVAVAATIAAGGALGAVMTGADRETGART